MTRRHLTLLAPAWARSAALAQAPDATPAPFHWKQDFSRELDDLRRKILDLARAMPQERFPWRPAADARSFSEVLLHVASSGLVNSMFLGAGLPEGVRLSRDPKQWETSTGDKGRIVTLLDLSFEQMHKVMAAKTEEDLPRPVRILGASQPLYRVFHDHCAHLHEHLGQMIAYARANAVVPPWSN